MENAGKLIEEEELREQIKGTTIYLASGSVLVIDGAILNNVRIEAASGSKIIRTLWSDKKMIKTFPNIKI